MKIFSRMFISVFLWLVDIVNYYPNADSPYNCLYWDCEDPFYISFSLFRFVLVYYLIGCYYKLCEIQEEWIYITEVIEDETK